MRVISKRALVEFWSRYPDSKTGIEDWYSKVTAADWDNFASMKKSFNSVDNVGNKRYVFNIKGNNYRIVAIVLFVAKQVYIRFVGTHSEYDKIENIKNI